MDIETTSRMSSSTGHMDLPFMNSSAVGDLNISMNENDDACSSDDYTPQLSNSPKLLHINVNGLKMRYTDLRTYLLCEKNIIACGLSETRLTCNDLEDSSSYTTLISIEMIG